MRSALAPLLLLLAVPAQAQGWSDVAALFKERCVVCHSGEFAPLGLRLDSYDSAVAGSEDGPVVVAGDPSGSRLLGRLLGVIEPRMPLDGPPFLEPGEIAKVEAWIVAGLPRGEADAAEVPAPGVAARPDGEVWYQDVEGILKQRCVKCHSDGSILGAPPEGLRLSSLALMLSGGDRTVIVPGNPPMSLLWRHVAGLEEPRMPFDGPPWLSDDQIDLIARWIGGGSRDEVGQPAGIPVGGRIRVEGVLTGEAEIDGGPFVMSAGTRVDDEMQIGGWYELRATVGTDGSIVAERLRAR